MKSFSAIIGKLGGATKAARILGTSQQNAHGMMVRNSIPPRYWPKIVQVIDDVSLADLSAMAAERERGSWQSDTAS